MGVDNDGDGRGLHGRALCWGRMKSSGVNYKRSDGFGYDFSGTPMEGKMEFELYRTSITQRWSTMCGMSAALEASP